MQIDQNHVGRIGLPTATAISLNTIIGAGPFGAPTTLADNNGIIAIIIYVFALAVVWTISYSLSYVAYLHTGPGSFYRYTHSWAGSAGAWLITAMYIMSTITAMAVLVNIAETYFTHVIPFPTVYIGLSIIGFSVACNLLKLRFSQISQLTLLCSTVFLLLTTVVICFIQADMRNIVIPDTITLDSIITPSYSVIFGFLGFEAATALHTIVRDARTTIPRAITYSVMATGVLYLMYIAALIVAVPREAYLHDPVLLTTLLTYVSPHTWALNYAVHFSLLSAIVGTIHATTWSSGVLLRTVTPRFPVTGRIWENISVILIGAGIAITYLMLGDIGFGVRITVIMRMIVYAAALFSIIIIPQSWQNRHAYIALCGILIAAYIAVITIRNISAV